MKAISNGNRFDIFDDNLKTYNELPAQVYSVRFDKMTGFYLELHSDIELKEEKVYGVHKSKVKKVLKAFDNTNRNLGVILSGDKGIGKSLFAKLLSVESVNKNIPVIIVDTYIPGVASYIEEITQEVMILFDEFDKTFGGVKNAEGQADPQTELLTLFDGIASGKKLFVITCNELRHLNDYLVNRPGRFHYHFRFEYPNADEIKEYLEDKLEKKYHSEIEAVIKFSRKINLNYDCLRAIATELNFGYPFAEAIKDLNILNMDNERYNVKLTFKNGKSYSKRNVPLDMFNTDKEESVWLENNRNESIIEVIFNTSECDFNPIAGTMFIHKETIKIDFDEDYYGDEYKELFKELKNTEVESLTITKAGMKNLHYLV